MGSGGSKTQQNNNYQQAQNLDWLLSQEALQSYDPRGWQNAMQAQVQQQDNPQPNMGAANDYYNYHQQANNYYQQDPQTFGQNPLDFNQLAQQQTPQVPQSYVRSNIDLNQLYGQQPVQQPVQQVQQSQPVQQQGRQGTVRSNNSNVFNEGVGITFNFEGTRLNVDKKRGLKSKYGITNTTLERARNNGLVKTSNVENLTLDDAKKIYMKMYWEPSGAGRMATPIGILYCDTYFNGGGGEVLNKTLNRYLGRQVAKGSSVSDKTINTINSVITDDDKLHRFLNIFCDERAARFRRLKNAPKNLKGWLKRNEAFRNWANRQTLGGGSTPTRQQAPAPQVTPEYPVDFSQDYLQDVPPAKTYGIYPNYWDYITSPEYNQQQRQIYGGVNY